MESPLPAELYRALAATVGPAQVLMTPAHLTAYEHDAFLVRHQPLAVVLPDTTAEVVQVVRLAQRWGLPVTPRGAGTGLAGGATPIRGGLVVSTARLRRIVAIDAPNRRAVVQPGVINADLAQAAAVYGLTYAPDPSSQAVSTVGGNVATNAGGPHCLAYGVTTNHVLAVEVVLAGGQVVHCGAAGLDTPSLDLRGLLVGSEGTLGLVTAVTGRLQPQPETAATVLAMFRSPEAAGKAASSIVAGGVIPTALELIDPVVLRALRLAGYQEYPETGAVLLIDVEGLQEEVAEAMRAVRQRCLAVGAQDIQAAANPAARARLWAGRKGALGAFGHLQPNYYIIDGVVPRTQIARVLRTVSAVAQRYDLLIATLMHAGDGNMHPTILFDARQPGALARVERAGAEILRACVDAGGTLTGEHGVGLERQEFLPWVLGPQDLAAQRRVQQAFDPADLFNPGKVFPQSSSPHRLA